MRTIIYLTLPAALLALAACDGTGPRVSSDPGQSPDPGQPGGPGEPPTMLRDLVIDQINNTDRNAAPVDINNLDFEIDSTPIDLELVTG